MSEQPYLPSVKLTHVVREKLGWFCLNNDGTYTVIFYYPRTDKFMRYTAHFALEVVEPGEEINADEMLAIMNETPEDVSWNIAKMGYFYKV